MAAEVFLATVADEEAKTPILGVGVLRYPATGESSVQRMVRECAMLMAKDHIYQGVVLILPNTRDEEGRFEWDFTIVGGDPGQVIVKRQGE